MSGLDSYYDATGQLVFYDNRTNGIFTSAGDAALLNSNLQAVTSGNPAQNFSTWVNNVQTGELGTIRHS